MKDCPLKLHWELLPYHELSLNQLYSILRLRQQVFVVEQACVYNDLDNKDQQSHHLMAWDADCLAAYTRLLPSGVSYAEATSIGRVIVAPRYRHTGLGKALMTRSIKHNYDLFGDQTIKIGAQQHLARFYNSLGFDQTSASYLEDGIPHIEMTLSAALNQTFGK